MWRFHPHTSEWETFVMVVVGKPSFLLAYSQTHPCLLSW